MRIFVTLIAILLLGAQTSDAQESRIALVKVLEGSAFTVQGGERKEVTVGQQIFRQDIVETASEAGVFKTLMAAASAAGRADALASGQRARAGLVRCR